ncbi:hypothetical protein MWU52_09375 [Jannaschia sp. S6380]|uniref:hypothetical protein n=1 Tax=Jannaschia sp. S6380 TaxID=2926408 RepID=UPI001FF512F6|nr:hypothetical protein [Jannaschia sp. S6380]MCK0167755.1 hypothetical protein [Jannaschia sp. S6380]
MRLAADIHVLAGRFASQQLAYAHLLDAAEAGDLSPDLDHIEVIAAPGRTRLSAYFDEDTTAALITGAAGDTLVLILPGALLTEAFAATAHLRDLGRHPGHVSRAMIP